jgi:1-acyl-sn-glycerol-3-phosphate acyltransferase
MRLVIELLRPFVWWLCRLMFKIEFHGVENVPLEGPCLITPNHASYADPIWITIPIRRRVHYMTWGQLFKVPGLGLVMRMFGAFPVNLDGADASAHRLSIKLLREGKALVVFPEGGRTRTGRMTPFKLGAFRLALTLGVPIIPVTIEGATSIWPANRTFPRPGKLSITYHPPIEVGLVPELTSRTEIKEQARIIARRTFEAIASGLNESQVESEAGQSASL